MKKCIIKIVSLLFVMLVCQLGQAQKKMFDVCPLKVGEEVPTVQLNNIEGEAVELKNIIATKPSVIIFYRGAWCGYCTKHLAELNDIKEEVEALGYQMFGVTVDQPSKLVESQPEEKNEIPVYSDSKLEAIKAFGLDWEVSSEMFEKYKTEYKLDLESWSGESHHNLPVPAIFIVSDGHVDFQYVNPKYRNRLKAETLMAILKTL